ERIGHITAHSPLYETAALTLPGSPPQPPYLNGAVLVETSSDPEAILALLLTIEHELGRDRSKETERWCARAIDVDLIGVECLIVSSASLTLPHPEMHRRDFVLVPVCDVSPEWRHPLLGKTARQLRDALLPRNRESHPLPR